MIWENNPVLIEFTNSAYYGERIFPICGQKTYIRTKSFLGITKMEYREYLEYKDGMITEQSMWIDFDYCYSRIDDIYSIDIN